jgi:ubiquinol-cytochrome c reductase iron-sulfur subunit
VNDHRPSGPAVLVGILVALRLAWRTLRGRRPGSAAPGGPVARGGPDGPVVPGGPGGPVVPGGPGGPVVPGGPGGPVVPGGGPDPDDPRRREVPSDPRAELWVALLLLAAAVCAICFIVVYVVEQFDTQLLGLAIGVCFALLAAAAIIAGKRVVPQETEVEERGELLVGTEAHELTEMVESGGEGISRRGLLTCATCLAGGAVAAAIATPAASLGPAARSLHASPWRRGTRLIDADSGRPIDAADVQIGTFYTALAEGADPEGLASSVLLVRLPPRFIQLPRSRRGWAPRGLMAYSKICPHAGCAISLYRYPTYAPSSVKVPAFTCPCHYSTFTPGDGGRVIFGPAGRELPQLPLMVDRDGTVRAAGDFNADVGPSWWGVRRS